MAYSLLAAWWVGHSWDRWLKGSSTSIKLPFLLVPLGPALLVTAPWPLSRVGAAYLLSGLAALYAVSLVYLIGIYGIYRVARSSRPAWRPRLCWNCLYKSR